MYNNASTTLYVGVNNSTGTLFGGTGGAYGGAISMDSPYGLGFATSGIERLRITNSGNAGLGVTPSTWSSNYVALQFGAKGVLWSNKNSSDWYLGNNELYNSSNQLVYLSNGRATEYFQFDGKHVWEVATTGTAGNIITYNTAMVLTNNSNLLISTTTDAGQKLQVNGTATIKSGNGDQLLLNNAGERFTQINFSNNSNSKANIWWDNTNTELVLLAANSGVGTLKLKNSGVLNIPNIPTSAAGLVSGDIYSNAGILTIVP